MNFGSSSLVSTPWLIINIVVIVLEALIPFGQLWDCLVQQVNLEWRFMPDIFRKIVPWFRKSANVGGMLISTWSGSFQQLESYNLLQRFACTLKDH